MRWIIILLRNSSIKAPSEWKNSISIMTEICHQRSSNKWLGPIETTTTMPTPIPTTPMPILNEVQVQQCKDEQVKLLKEKLKIEKIIGFYKIKEVMEHAKRAGYNIKNSDPEYQPFQNKHI